MLVFQLIKKLKKFNDFDKVLISSDEEGNSIKELYSIEECLARKEGNEFVMKLRDLTPELRQEGYTDEDVGDVGDESAIVLFP